VLQTYNIEAQTPDVFLLHLVDLSARAVFGVLEAQASALRNPPMSIDELLDHLAQSGLPRSIAALRAQ
jgi:hypothetical protein